VERRRKLKKANMTDTVTQPENSVVAEETGNRFLAALRNAGVRRFTSGTIAWGTGHQMITASQGFVLYEMTGSALWIAWLGAAVGGTNVIAAIIGGVLSDRIQRRTMLMAGATIAGVPMLAIAILYATDSLQPWHILLAGGAQGISLAIDWISRLSLLPTMVPRRIMVSALSVDQAAFNGARVIGPLIAAGVLSSFGPTASYGIIGGLFAVAILIYTTFTTRPIEKKEGDAHPAGLAAIAHEMREAGSALRADSILSLNVVFTAMNAMMLGGFVFMIPVFAKDVFNSGEGGLGLIFAATGTGAFTGALIIATRGGIDSAGRALVVSNLLFAGAAATYTTTGNLALAAVVGYFVGLFNALHVAMGIAAIQVNVPDAVRGRVTGVYELAWASFPLGGLVAGSLAWAFSPRSALAITAAAVATLTVLVFAFSSRMRNLTLNPKD
jgi:MFS family permease